MSKLKFLGKIIDPDAAKAYGATYKAKGMAALDDVADSIDNLSSGRMARTLGRTGRAAGRGLINVGSSRAGMGAVAVGAIGMGMASSIGPATKDAALGAAFGDENADTYFTGRDLDARFLAGQMMGGVGGGILKASSPGDNLAINPIIPGPTAMLGASAATGVMGGVAGGTIGAAVGTFVGGAFGISKTGKVAGGIMGTIAGAATGAALPTSAFLGGHVARNQEFYRQSPYSSSSSTASQLGASGDIVLGMHNSRRGY